MTPHDGDCTCHWGRDVAEQRVRAEKAEAAIRRVRAVLASGDMDRGWGQDDDFDAGWDRCAADVRRALDGDGDD